MSTNDASANETTPTPPVLTVVSGNPTPEEIAALTAVLAAASAGGGSSDGPRATRSLWSDSTKAPGHRLAPGPGAWRASALPH